MQCRIDHSQNLALPVWLCRACSPTVFTCEPNARAAVTEAAQEDWPFAVRRDNLTPADIATMYELQGRAQARDDVKAYEAGKRFAEFEQRRLENPELHAMERKAKRDADRRVARMGLKATGKVRKRKSAA